MTYKIRLKSIEIYYCCIKKSVFCSINNTAPTTNISDTVGFLEHKKSLYLN